MEEQEASLTRMSAGHSERLAAEMEEQRQARLKQVRLSERLASETENNERPGYQGQVLVRVPKTSHGDGGTAQAIKNECQAK